MRVALDGETETLTERIIGAGFEVSNTLGHGFLEAVYKKAFIHELQTRSLGVGQEVPFQIDYKGKSVGTYFADLFVESRIIVELKVVEELTQAHTRQVLNHLRASKIPIGQLFNFGAPRLAFRRVLLRPAESV